MGDVTFQTSGSCGAPKDVPRSEETLLADARALVSTFPSIWQSHPLVVATAPTNHLYGFLWRKLAAAIARCESLDETIASVETLEAVCAERDGTVLFVTTPSFLEKAVGHPAFAALRGKVVAVVSSGSMLPKEVALAVKDVLGVCPYDLLGSTETGSVAWRKCDEQDSWSPLYNVGISLNASGCLLIDSPGAMTRPMSMSDTAIFVEPGRFVLKGRTDRLVKVLEEFVSLDEVERVFQAHPFVDSARAVPVGEGVKRIGILVVLSEAGRQALAEGTYGHLRRKLRLDLIGAVGPLAFPRRMRFVHALPVNNRGKTSAADIEGILDSWCQEPAVLKWNTDGVTLHAEMVFPPDNPCFDGHFPAFAVLPGVAELFFLRHFARKVFSDFPDAGTWRRLKFQKIILPGEQVSLDVARRPDGAFSFSFSKRGEPCSSGLVIGGASS